jgi:hypothetical protein
MTCAIDLVANKESPLSRFGERASTFVLFACLSQAEQMRPPAKAASFGHPLPALLPTRRARSANTVALYQADRLGSLQPVDGPLQQHVDEPADGELADR